MKVSNFLKIAESCMVVSVYDADCECVMYTAPVRELITKPGLSDLEIVGFNHSEAEDDFDIELVVK